MSQSATATVLRRLALDEDVKSLVLTSERLYRPLLRAASRYIGGESLEACLTVAAETTARGHAVTIDYMGESTRTRGEALEATAEFVRVAEAIHGGRFDASVSLDLSHIGLLVDSQLCFENALAIAAAAASAGTEVIVGAEGTDRTDQVLAMHGRLCERVHNVGITIQAYLHRSAEDLDAIIARPGKIRVVKGAFDADPALVMPRGADLDAAYVALVRELDHARRPFSVATHDAEIIARTKSHMDEGAGEYEMLRGVEGELLDSLHQTGYRTREYLPYGKDWFLYLCNRIAEAPVTLFDAIAAAYPIPG